MQFLNYALYLVLAIGGFFIGYLFYKKSADTKINSAKERADKIVNEARMKEKELLLKAQDKAIKVIEESKREESRRRNEIQQMQKRLEQRKFLFPKTLRITRQTTKTL